MLIGLAPRRVNTFTNGHLHFYIMKEKKRWQISRTIPNKSDRIIHKFDKVLAVTHVHKLQKGVSNCGRTATMALMEDIGSRRMRRESVLRDCWDIMMHHLAWLD